MLRARRIQRRKKGTLLWARKRCRAYEIYLERNGFGGNELDDWLQAEMELVSDALLARTTSETKRKA